MQKFFAALVLCLLFLPTASAAESFVIKNIRVQGLQRISKGTVFNYLPVTIGERLTPARMQKAINALFKTGFFEDVQLERQGHDLIVVVRERPSIDHIKITGAKEIGKKVLRKALAEIGLSKGRVFKRSMFDLLEQQLRNQYFARGYYAVRITPTITKLPRNRVAVNVAVAEGKVAKIRQITIVGNGAYKQKTLLKRFTLGTPNLFSIFTKNDQYSKQKLRGDLEKLRSYYEDRGYLEFAIDSTQVSITPDKESVYITVNVTQGQRYRVSSYRLVGRFPVPQEQIQKLVSIKPGGYFSRQQVTDSTKRITDLLGDRGYAFAKASAVPKIDRTTHEVSFRIVISPGPRVYVRKVIFTGNTSTRDYVLRREMRQFEGGLFSSAQIRESVKRLKRLGFFNQVTVDTRRVPGHPDQVDVNVHVKERPTGSFLIGVGYSDLEGPLVNGSISYQNLFGTGKSISLSANNSAVDKYFNLNYTNPYYTESGISRSFNLFASTFNATAANIGAYNSSTRGAGVNYGIPISENRVVNGGLTFERVQFSVTSASPEVAQLFVDQYGSDNRVLKANVGWTRDTLNNAIFPTKGTYQSISGQLALPGGLEYYKLAYLTSLYYPVSRRTTVKMDGQLAYGNGYGNTQGLPFFENFFAGGSNSVRGYQARSLGPKDVLPPYYPIGGNKEVLASVEYLFPVPGTSAHNRSMRFSVFVDSGMVYGPAQRVDLGQLRYSVGIAFNWFSPIAPLSISLAHALNAQPGDSTQALQFTLGTLFQ
ncbi:MAG: outer membrane protein assembly factor BamA [Acidiferrobacteraceae bacterium]